MKKLLNIALALIILAIITALAEALAGAFHNKGSFNDLFTGSIIAMSVLGLMALAAYGIGMLPLLNKLPVIFWVSIIAAVLCSPLCPYGKEFYAITENISFTIICTVVLAFAGLSLGKDIQQFKTISWRIIPVSLAVFSGTFIFAALIGQITLSLSKVI